MNSEIYRKELSKELQDANIMEDMNVEQLYKVLETSIEVAAKIGDCETNNE